MRSILQAIQNLRLRSAFAVWRREVTVYKKTYAGSLLANFFEPLIYLLGMGLGLGGLIREIDGVSYFTYIAPGLVAVSAMNGALFESTWNVFVRLNMEHIFDGIIATPCSPEDVVTGEFLWAMTRSLIYGIAFVTILLLFGEIRTWWILLVPLPLALTGGLFAAIALSYTGLISRIDRYNYFWTLFVTPMFVFSGVFFPLEGMPKIVQMAAWCTPLYHSVGLTRDVLWGNFDWSTIAHAIWLIAAAIPFYFLALAKLRRKMVA